MSSMPLSTYFNSIKVQLKLGTDTMLDTQYPYFNSIKVQLKQTVGILSNYTSLKFQFHKGTIKTPMLEQADSYNGISIP